MNRCHRSPSIVAIALLACGPALAVTNPPAPAQTETPNYGVTGAAGSGTRAASAPGAKLAAAPSGPTGVPRNALFFRYDGVDDNFGRLAVTTTDHPEVVRFAGELRCEAVHASVERGICVRVQQRLLGVFSADLFDPVTFVVTGQVPAQGIPSRARVAHGGRLAAFTVFTSGHSYGATSFSTRTVLVDAVRATELADLETFAVTKDGKPFKNKDFNFWGVTFTPDARRFYATLSTEGQYYLVLGDPSARTATVVHTNVECPSLSPDGRRIAYKKRIAAAGPVAWELQSLDVASGRETPLAERRSIDDQLEWLDNDTVLYTVASAPGSNAPNTDVWRVAANGTGVPQLFLRNASSPAVLR